MHDENTPNRAGVVEWIGQTLATAFASGKPSPDRAALQADYQVSVDVIKLLTDIRFRCLVFVTSIITLAGLFLKDTDAAVRIALGLVGFVATLGIAIYELRNSQLYEAAIHRAKALEKLLTVVRTTSHNSLGGLFSERPPYVDECYWKGLIRDGRPLPKGSDVQLMRFLFVKVKHDSGLALIYGGALAGWAYLVANSGVSLALYRNWLEAPNALRSRVAAAIIGLLMFVIATGSFMYHDRKRFRPEEPQEGVKMN